MERIKIFHTFIKHENLKAIFSKSTDKTIGDNTCILL